MTLRTTHTVVFVELSADAFEEIKAKLEAADYGHAFFQDGDRLAIDMSGIAVASEAEASVPAEKAAAGPLAAKASEIDR
jgi:hypothetical protein